MHVQLPPCHTRLRSLCDHGTLRDLDNFYQSAPKRTKAQYTRENFPKKSCHQVVLQKLTLRASVAHLVLPATNAFLVWFSFCSCCALCDVSTSKTLSLRSLLSLTTFATRPLRLYCELQSVLRADDLPSTKNCCHTYPRSHWRSHCDLQNVRAERKRSKVFQGDLVTRQVRERNDMNYLELLWASQSAELLRLFWTCPKQAQ